jgi:hypothetical protein
VILATIIIIFGSIAYYFSSNLTTTATNSYTSSASTSQQAIAERLGFENVLYNSSPATLTVYIINSGSTSNVQINTVFIYDVNHSLVGQPQQGSQPGNIFNLYNIDNNAPIQSNSLNVGQEGYLTVPNVSLMHGSIYTVQLITKNGSNFNYEFYA